MTPDPLRGMPPRAKELIERLNLEPHPEGGFYRRVFQSAQTVTRTTTGDARTALTSIYFLLVDGSHSRWHRVASDEVWHFYEGDPVELAIASPSAENVQSTLLGPVSGETRPQHVVPANGWQAARTLGSYSLVGCSVAPGFEYTDFDLAFNLADNESLIRERLGRYSQFM